MKQFNALGAYIFAGGFTIGMAKHFNIVGHFEDGPFGVKTFQQNFPDVEVFPYPNNWPAQDFQGVDVLYTNPPCAPWSLNRHIMPYDQHPLFQCSVRNLELFKTIQPTIWAQECVTELAKPNNGLPHVKHIAEEAAKLGYQTTIMWHDGRFLGLAQARRRIFIVSHRVRFNPAPPSGTTMTVGQALEGAPVLHTFKMPATWYPLLQEMGPGIKPRRWLEERGRGLPQPKFRISDIILREDSLAPTILGWPMPCYIRWQDGDPRFLTLGEITRMMSYPDDYKWSWPMTKPAEILLEATRTVTPAVGEWLGQAMAEALMDNGPIEDTGLYEIKHVAASNKTAETQMAVTARRRIA